MEKTELIDGILKLSKQLDNNHGMGSIDIVDARDRLIDAYVEQLNLALVSKSFACSCCKTPHDMTLPECVECGNKL